MSIPSTPLPHFSGKNELSLQDLDALGNALRAQGLASELIPAAAHHGHRQYTGANFNLSQFDDACTGAASTPDKPGLIASVSYSGGQDAPYIDSGNLVLPLAHDYSPSDSSLPDESATGGVASINVVEDLKRPQINRGDIRLPLAQSDWGDDAEGAMYTPGLVYGVQYDNADACEGAVLPRIDQGIIHLPSSQEGGSGCACELAQYDECGAQVGLIQSVEFVGYMTRPKIVDGAIQLPLATTNGACPGVCGGVQSVIMDSGAQEATITNGIIRLPVPGIKGLQTINGPMSWDALACAGMVRLYEADAMGFGVQAEVTSGYLRIYVDRS